MTERRSWQSDFRSGGRLWRPHPVDWSSGHINRRRRAPFQRGEWPVCSQQTDLTVIPLGTAVPPLNRLKEWKGWHDHRRTTRAHVIAFSLTDGIRFTLWLGTASLGYSASWLGDGQASSAGEWSWSSSSVG